MEERKKEKNDEMEGRRKCMEGRNEREERKGRFEKVDRGIDDRK